MIFDFSKLHSTLTKKPLVVGGRAIEYSVLHQSGNDIDLIVPREDLWGHLGVCPYEFEME